MTWAPRAEIRVHLRHCRGGPRGRTLRRTGLIAALLSRFGADLFDTVIAFTERGASGWHDDSKKTAPSHLQNPITRNAAITTSPALFTAIEALVATRASAVLSLNRLFGGFSARKNRDTLAATYQNLLCADDHILRDIGMTRLDVMRLREDLFRR
jgi:hypothetical protein